jgi:DNA-binding NtrC family response regulator
MKILLVEDDDAVRNTLLTVLQEYDHTVEEATSAEEALVKLPGDYSLVIADVLLAQMDGITFLDQVNRMQKRVPVVIITGLGISDTEAVCRGKGAAGFLDKPFSVRKLLSLVEDVGKKAH